MKSKLPGIEEKLQNNHYNNIYDFLDKMLAYLFTRKEEKRLFLGFVEEKLFTEKDVKLVDLENTTEEFDLWVYKNCLRRTKEVRVDGSESWEKGECRFYGVSAEKLWELYWQWQRRWF